MSLFWPEFRLLSGRFKLRFSSFPIGSRLKPRSELQLEKKMGLLQNVWVIPRIFNQPPQVKKTEGTPGRAFSPRLLLVLRTILLAQKSANFSVSPVCGVPSAGRTISATKRTKVTKTTPWNPLCPMCSLWQPKPPANNRRILPGGPRPSMEYRNKTTEASRFSPYSKALFGPARVDSDPQEKEKIQKNK